MTLPGMASIPAVDSAHYRMAAASGRRIVAMVWEDLTPARVLTRDAFENAIATVLALGGSTNAFIHLIAMAGRAAVDLTLDDFDAIARRVPWLANIQPSGKYLMEDFYYAGGLRALMGQLALVPGALHLDSLTVSGQPLGAQITDVPVYNEDVIRTPDTALSAEGGVAVLRGNLAPDGAVIKHIAAEPRLLKHTGPAVVFDSYSDMQARINDPALGVTPDSVLVLRNAGPKGGPGMPEYGMLPIPSYLLEQGVRDMVRISDARMSGTSYGACVLHVAPESFTGGPLALVRTGDMITLDVAARQLSLDISKRTLAERQAAWQPPVPKFERGYGALYSEHITQANEGCDFEFLARRARTPDPEPNPQLPSAPRRTMMSPEISRRSLLRAGAAAGAGAAVLAAGGRPPTTPRDRGEPSPGPPGIWLPTASSPRCGGRCSRPGISRSPASAPSATAPR